jgi:hypothetical protein
MTEKGSEPHSGGCVDMTTRVLPVLADTVADMEEATKRAAIIVSSLATHHRVTVDKRLSVPARNAPTVPRRLAIAAVVLVGAIGWFAQPPFAFVAAAPLTVQSVQPLDPKVSKATGSFFISVDVNMHRTCFSSYERVWVHPNGAIVARQRIEGGPGTMTDGFEKRTVRVKLPVDLEPAAEAYTVRTKAKYECGGSDGESFLFAFPDYQITVTG